MDQVAGDPLLDLVDLPGLEPRLAAARSAVDSLLWDREVRRSAGEIAAESVVRAAWANAWFEGGQVGIERVRDGSAMDASPLGRLLAGVSAMHAEAPRLVPIVSGAPAQALARMHSVVAHGWSADEELGRPRAGEPDDPLRIGVVPDAADVPARLAALFELMSATRAPAILVAAVAHAELAVLRPFSWGSGLVARAFPRLVLAARGVDPSMLGAPEVGLRAIPRHSYVRSLRGYATGAPDRVADFLGMVAGAIESGAREPAEWLRATG